MKKVELSNRFFELAKSVQSLPATVRGAIAKAASATSGVAQKACTFASWTLDLVGMIVRGCGCASDDPMECGYGKFCECDCHNSNTASRTVDQETN